MEKKAKTNSFVPQFVEYHTESDIPCVEFIIDVPVIGKLTAIDNPFISKGKNLTAKQEKANADRPEKVLALDGKVCPSNYQLLKICQDILDKKIKQNTMARITFIGEKKVGKGKAMKQYKVEIAA
jgi:hypothetical protein